LKLTQPDPALTHLSVIEAPAAYMQAGALFFNHAPPMSCHCLQPQAASSNWGRA